MPINTIWMRRTNVRLKVAATTHWLATKVKIWQRLGEYNSYDQPIPKPACTIRHSSGFYFEMDEWETPESNITCAKCAEMIEHQVNNGLTFQGDV